MCSKCSHGAPEDGHEHISTMSEDAIRLGLAGHEAALGEVIDGWLADRHGVDVLALDLLW